MCRGKAASRGRSTSGPPGLGFEKFYGNVIGESDQFSPVAHDNTTLAPPSKDPNYYYQTDLADRAIQWIKAQKSLNPDKPFFVYYPAQGMHDPVQLPKAWRDKYKGKFDQGWDKYREEILARQKKLGIVPENTKLTAKADIAPDWDTLTADEKKVAIRYQELFAAFAELTDYEIGRVVQAIEDVGVLDNTLIIYVTGDNGASPNGGRLGVFNTMSTFNQSPETLEYQLKHLDEVGGPHSAMTPPAGWSFGDNTPFAYSQLHTQLGGTTNGAIVSWPKGIKAKGEIRSQYHHVIDIAPTVLAAAGLPQPKTVNGVVAKTHRRREHDELLRRRAGEVGAHDRSTTRSTATAASTRTAGTPRPCTRCRGSRNRARSYADDKWELCNMAEDFSCSTDVSAQHPDKLKELQAAFMAEAIKYNVLPLDDRAQERFNATLAGRPDVHGRPHVADALSGHDRDEGERLHRREEPELLDHRRARIPSGGVGRHPRARWRALRLEPLRQGRAAHVCLQLPGRRDDHHFQRAPAGRPSHRHLRFRLRRRQAWSGRHRDALDQREEGRLGQTRAHHSIHLRRRDRRRRHGSLLRRHHRLRHRATTSSPERSSR